MESLEEWTPDIVVGIDFGMTFTGLLSSSGHCVSVMCHLLMFVRARTLRSCLLFCASVVTSQNNPTLAGNITK